MHLGFFREKDRVPMGEGEWGEQAGTDLELGLLGTCVTHKPHPCPANPTPLRLPYRPYCTAYRGPATNRSSGCCRIPPSGNQWSPRSWLLPSPRHPSRTYLSCFPVSVRGTPPPDPQVRSTRHPEASLSFPTLY